MTVSNTICTVCQKPAKYKAPKTELSYCSVACFRQLPQSEETTTSNLSSNSESSCPNLVSTTRESFLSSKWEADEEKDEQFRQLAQSKAIQELLQDRTFCQKLQDIVNSKDPLEKLLQVRNHEKFAQFEQAVFDFFHLTDDQI